MVARGARESVREWPRTWNDVDREGFFELLSPRFVGKGVMAPQGIDGVWFHQIGVDPDVGAPPEPGPVAAVLLPTGHGG